RSCVAKSAGDSVDVRSSRDPAVDHLYGGARVFGIVVSGGWGRVAERRFQKHAAADEQAQFDFGTFSRGGISVSAAEERADRFGRCGERAVRARKRAGIAALVKRRARGFRIRRKRVRARRAVGGANRMTLLIGALTIGFILSLLALGVFISFRVFA